jgi:DNA-3-methyladenine glycosylase I
MRARDAAAAPRPSGGPGRPARPRPRRAAAPGADRARCAWAAGADPLSRAYHDREWGVPVRDDRRLFELLVLEGAQAGLSWATILRKRDGYRRAFAGFDPRRVARFGPARVARLLADPGIVRNRLKIEAAVANARATLAVQREFGSLARFLWDLAGGAPRVNAWRAPREVPARTAASDAMSAALRRRGFRFVGSTICYAFMQATGMVDDHTVDCFRHPGARAGGGRRAPVKRRSSAST